MAPARISSETEPASDADASTAVGALGEVDVAVNREHWSVPVKRYLNSVAWRFGGAAIGAAGAVLTARWLGPEKLGISGIVQATVTASAIFVMLGRDISLVRTYRGSADANARRALASEVFLGRLIASFVIGLAQLVLAWAFHVPTEFWIAVAAGFFSLVLTSTLPTWILQAHDDVPAQQRYSALQAGLTTCLIILILKPLPAAGLDVLLGTLALGVGWASMWHYVLRRHVVLDLAAVSPSSYFRKTWNERHLFFTAVLIYIYVNLQQQLVATLCSVTELGRYRPALQVVQAVYPFLALIPAIMYPRLIDWSKHGASYLFQRQLRLCGIFTLVLTPCMGAGFLLMPWAFPRIFGSEYASGALPCAILLASKGFVVLNSIFSWGLWAQGFDKAMLAVIACVACVSLLLSVTLIPRYGALAASIVACLSEVGVLIGTVLLSWRQTLTKQPV